jgi:hypothetical protein
VWAGGGDRNGGHTEASPLLGSGVVETSELVTDSELLSECRQLDKAMSAAPYNAQFVSPGMFAGAAAFKVTFTQPLAPTITVIRRNHFHDSAGCKGNQSGRLKFAMLVIPFQSF